VKPVPGPKKPDPKPTYLSSKGSPKLKKKKRTKEKKAGQVMLLEEGSVGA